MDDYSIHLYSDFFQNKLIFKTSEEGISLSNSSVSRLLKPIVIKNITNTKKIIKSNNPNEIYLIKDFLKYLSEKKIGDYLYLEINFNNFICVDSAFGTRMDFSLGDILGSESIQKFIKAYKYDENIIISTLRRYPLVPSNEIELQLNNLILEEVLVKLKPELDTLIKTNNIILSGEVIFSNWSGQLGLFNIIKKFPHKSNYNIIIDEKGLWKALLTKRNEVKWLYKINSTIFKPDMLFVNSLKFEKDKKIQLEGLDKQFIINPEKYVNSIKYIGNLFPRLVVINSINKNSVLDLSMRELNNYILQSKNLVTLSKSNCIEFIKNGEFIFNLNEDSSVLIKQNYQVNYGKPLAEIIIKNVDTISINKKTFNTECVDKQLVHEKDLIGYEKKGFSTKPIRAKISGRLSFKYLDMGYILIEDNDNKNILKSPCDGTCKHASKKDLINLVTDYLKIPIAYQIGENRYANLSNNPNISFSNAKFYSEFKPESLSVKEIIDNNIKLIIYGKSDFLPVIEWFNKNPILFNFLSVAIVDENFDGSKKYIEDIFNINVINGISIEDGELKLLCDFSSAEYRRLKNISKLEDSNAVRVISFERKKNYGNIMKSLSSTEKLVRFSQIESIEKDSNLINQMFKL